MRPAGQSAQRHPVEGRLGHERRGVEGDIRQGRARDEGARVQPRTQEAQALVRHRREPDAVTARVEEPGRAPEELEIAGERAYLSRELLDERVPAAPQTLRVRATLYSAAATVTGAVVSTPR